MHRIFAGMAIWAVIFLVGEGVLGYVTRHHNPELIGWNMIGGIFVGIYICILHIMVMFHFIGSGKEIKEATRILGGDSEVVRRVSKFKQQVFPYATFAPIVVGAAVILGGEAQMNVWGIGGWLHWTVGIGGLVLNLVAFPIEYRALKANLELLREVDEKIKRELAPGFYR